MSRNLERIKTNEDHLTNKIIKKDKEIVKCVLNMKQTFFNPCIYMWIVLTNGIQLFPARPPRYLFSDNVA